MRRLFVLAALLALVVFQALPAQARTADTDRDLIEDAVDVCPEVADPYQGDLDGDGIGDLCDPDATGAGTAAADLLIGTSGPDTLAGLGGDDALYGLDGDDTLDGGAGRDFLAGGAGADRLTGGGDCDVFAANVLSDADVITDYQPGVDRLRFPAQDADPSDDVAPAATFGGDDHLVVAFGEGETAATLEFEGLEPGTEIEFDTSPCDPPSALPPCIYAGDGGIEDFFDGILILGSLDIGETLIGTRCNDLIVGDTGTALVIGEGPLTDELVLTYEGIGDELPEIVDGVLSDDFISGLAGMDLLIGDWLELTGFAVGGNDVIDGGADIDIIGGDALVLSGAAQGGEDTITGGDGDDILAGEAIVITGEAVGGNDTVHGDAGDDIITGDAYEISGGARGGNDLIYGGAGSDLITGDTSVLTDFAAGGDDTIYGGDGNDEIGGDAGEDMSGSAIGGNDTIYGDAGDDLIYGDSGSSIDDLAVAGNDTIDGGPGDDILYGDTPTLGPAATAGADTFLYALGEFFGDDEIRDAGRGGTVDTIRFIGSTSNPDLTVLDLYATVTDDGTDVLAVVFTDSFKTTVAGTIKLNGIGTSALSSWQDIDDLPTIEVEDRTDYS